MRSGRCSKVGWTSCLDWPREAPPIPLGQRRTRRSPHFFLRLAAIMAAGWLADPAGKAVLGGPLRDVSIENATPRIVAAELSRLYDVCVCFEEAPPVPPGPETLQVRFSAATIEGVLDGVARLDPRYKWRYDEEADVYDLFPATVSRLADPVPVLSLNNVTFSELLLDQDPLGMHGRGVFLYLGFGGNLSWLKAHASLATNGISMQAVLNRLCLQVPFEARWELTNGTGGRARLALKACCNTRNLNRGRAFSVRRTAEAVFRVQDVKAAGGAATGFRIEVTNASKDKDLVLSDSADPSAAFEARLINDKWLDVSPMAADMPSTGVAAGKPVAQAFSVLRPASSRAWFLPVPKQCRIDPTKATNDGNLQPVPEGEYSVVFHLRLKLSQREPGSEANPKSETTREVRLIMPRLWIRVDPKSLTDDVIGAYGEEPASLQGKDRKRPTPP